MEDELKKFACRYAVVRFIPFAETEEFVNIGVIIACPSTGYFNFKLQKKKRHARVTHFFSELSKLAYHESVEMFSKELSRIQLLISNRSNSPDEIRAIFEGLVHPREAMIRFSGARSCLTPSPDQALGKFFQYYVERDFVTHEYTEQILERRVRTLVHGLNLSEPFKAMELGDDFAVAHFPLVQQQDSKPKKAIKPFYLAQVDPIKIINHGGLWIDRLRRMRNRNTLPNSVLFAVEGPPVSDVKRHSAFQEICDDLRTLEIQVSLSNAEQEIVDFAYA